MPEPLTASATVPTPTPELSATARGPEDLDRALSVVGSHLERFGRRNELQVGRRRP